METDKKDLLKFIEKQDDLDSEYVDYREILAAASANSSSTTQAQILFKMVVKIQKAWRTNRARKNSRLQRTLMSDSDLQAINAAIDVTTTQAGDKKGVDAKVAKPESGRAPAKGKKKGIVHADPLDAKLATVQKPQKESKGNLEKRRQE